MWASWVFEKLRGAVAFSQHNELCTRASDLPCGSTGFGCPLGSGRQCWDAGGGSRAFESQEGVLALIEKASSAGIPVSLGHSIEGCFDVNLHRLAPHWKSWWLHTIAYHHGVGMCRSCSISLRCLIPFLPIQIGPFKVTTNDVKRELSFKRHERQAAECSIQKAFCWKLWDSLNLIGTNQTQGMLEPDQAFAST